MSARPPWAFAGRAATIRSAAADDRAAVATFLAAMDKDGLYQRHFAHGEAPNIALLDRLVIADGRRSVVLLALDALSRVVGHAEYVAADDSAEFALMVLPEWRGCGLGQALLDTLMARAIAAGLASLHGLIQATNTGAQQVVRKCGFAVAPGDDTRTVIVSRRMVQALPILPGPPEGSMHAATQLPSRHDPDRVPLHRCPGP